MKKIFCLSIVFCLVTNVFGQAGFKWEKVDSVAKTKSQIYSDTKLFIAKTWKSAKDVIQNDDKESGVILIKGSCVQAFNKNLGFCPMEYVYDYMVTFKIKEGKFKIILDNVHCSSAHGGGGTQYQSINPIEPSDEIPYPFRTWGAISKKRAAEIMINLKSELQAIVDSYLTDIKYTVSAGSAKDNW